MSHPGPQCLGIELGIGAPLVLKTDGWDFAGGLVADSELPVQGARSIFSQGARFHVLQPEVPRCLSEG